MLDSQDWPGLGRDPPLDSRFGGVPDNLQDLNVPRAALSAIRLDDFTQAR